MSDHHPAPFSRAVLDLIRDEELLPMTGIVLDPFAGIGGVHELATDERKTLGIEIEPEWAAEHPRTRVGDATRLPFGANCFDGAVTSPTYGNRFSDHHRARDGSYRRSYTHDLRRLTGNPDRNLRRNNTGALRGTDERYWHLHRLAWAELARVLKTGAPFVLNISDYISRGEVMPMVDRHIALTASCGFDLRARYDVPTPRMRHGANQHLRVDTEAVLLLVSGGRRHAA